MTGESVFIKVPADTSADDIALVSLRAVANVIPATGTNPDKQSTTGGGTQTKSTSTTSASTTRKTLPKTADPCASWPVAPLLLAAAATLVVAAGLREKGKAAH
ncbi:MAG: hypothetical protein Q4C09_04320 [Atopobiaceae bacterium]|nr:hypothetical protein [Atopobiaceae bacterium]